MTRIKMCGITRQADMLAAIEAGADFLGFIFYERSPRCVTRDQAMTLTELLRGLDMQRVPQCVGVFVDPDPDVAARIVEKCRLQAVQIHRAAPEKLRAINTRLHGACYPAWQPQNVDLARADWQTYCADGWIDSAPWLPQALIDAFHPDLAGGTGQSADWNMARALRLSIDRLMLAGGLTPDNVGAAIRAARPWGVDVASGIESAPGQKDHNRIRAFAQAVRQADQEIGE